jgi:predicted DNA-binding transcriptional regulator YafY
MTLDEIHRRAGGRRAYNYKRRLRREQRIKTLFRLIEIEPNSTGRELAARFKAHEATISRDLKFIRKVKWPFDHGELGIRGFVLRAGGFKFTRGGGYECVAEISYGVRVR